MLFPDEQPGHLHTIIAIPKRIVFGRSRQALREVYFQAVDEAWSKLTAIRATFRYDSPAKTRRQEE